MAFVDLGQAILRTSVQKLPQRPPSAASTNRGSEAPERRGLRSRRRILVAHLQRRIIHYPTSESIHKNIEVELPEQIMLDNHACTGII